jgi:cysteine desulfurase/selenocysteine lyase
MASLLNVARLKEDFPIFHKVMRGDNSLIYLDSGATSQKPVAVLDAERAFYTQHNAAVHRGSHLLAEEASEAYEDARAKVAEFIGADLDEVVFTKSATESLNLIAYSMGNSAPSSRLALRPGDRIVVSEMEHHANLIPWQQLAKRTGAELAWFPVTPEGRLDLSDLDSIINERTKIVAITHQSNVLGTINPLHDLVARTHQVGALFVLDACQSVPHFAVDVKNLDIDFLAFSGHKAVGPTGVGVFWGRAQLLAEMEPFLTGGSMIESVTMTDATWAPAPRKFEAGVPNMAQAVGLGAAVDYLSSVGMQAIEEHERAISDYLIPKLIALPGLTLIGPADSQDRGAVFSFAIDGIHPHDLGQVLDQSGIAVRTGHHCAWPLMRKLGVVGTTRASFYLYNDLSDADALLAGIVAAQKYFKVI